MSEEALEALEAAAKYGIEVNQQVVYSIWDTTYKKQPYTYPLYVDVSKAATVCGDEHLLEDGDHIYFFSREKNTKYPKEKFHITLEQPNNTWWKALTAHTPPNTFSHEIVNVEKDNHSNEVLSSFKDMLSYFIVLSKAKSFGVHANMYWIQNSYDLTPDRDWIIKWTKD